MDGNTNMVLSDAEIEQELKHGELEVSPVDIEEQMQPSSLDIRLGNEFAQYLTPRGWEVNTRSDHTEKYRETFYCSEESGVVIEPGCFYLANTKEIFNIPDYLGAEIRGRSSLGRLGIEIHSCAGWVDPGFEGELVLEISNNMNAPVRLYPGDRVGQMVFYRLAVPSHKPYGERNNKYQNQSGPEGSRIWEDDDGE